MEKRFLEDAFLYDRYENPELLTGDKSASEPNMIKFRHSDMGCELLYNAIKNNVPIVFHGDVDMDGLFTTRLMTEFLKGLSPNHSIKTCINKEKTHGVSERHVGYFNAKSECLVVILDSGSNDIEYIKQFNHNVLVVDHHDVLHTELKGNTANGVYCIISNMVDGESLDGTACYISDSRMSAGLVLYEFLRYFQAKYNLPNILEMHKLHQLMAITLYTDIVNTDRPRNIFYIDKSLGNGALESSLDILKNTLSPYSILDKSFISYTLAPTFNRAIRAGLSGRALDIAVESPTNISELLYLKEAEKELLTGFENNVYRGDGCTLKNISGSIGRNYSGLMANKLLDFYKESSLCFIEKSGNAEGSFRGKYKDVDYRKLISELGYFAQGHSQAFGYCIPMHNLGDIVKMVFEEESSKEHREYLSAGDSVSPEHRGVYHLNSEDWITFRKTGYAWKIGILNSKIPNNSQCINIVVRRDSLELTNEYEKMWEYTCLGITGCKSFEPIVSEYVYMYIEHSCELNYYLRNKWF